MRFFIDEYWLLRTTPKFWNMFEIGYLIDSREQGAYFVTQMKGTSKRKFITKSIVNQSNIELNLIIIRKKVNHNMI